VRVSKVGRYFDLASEVAQFEGIWLNFAAKRRPRLFEAFRSKELMRDPAEQE